jgi:uncharacterized protein
MRHRAIASRVHSLLPTFLLTALAIGLAGCASAPAPRPTASAEPPLAIIDAHVQTDFTNRLSEPGQVMHSKAELATEMEKYGVVGAVSMNHPGDPYADLSDLNVVQCVGLAAKVDAEKLEADLASGRFRCVTIYLGDEPRYASDPKYDPAYRLAERYRVPVVFHTVVVDNPPVLPAYADQLTAERVAMDHPGVTFVLSHVGNPRTADQRDHDAWLRRRASQAGIGVAVGDDPWIPPAVAVAHRNPNVVLDGSAFLTGDLLKATPEQVGTYLGERVNWVFKHIGDASKLMFGTAWPKTEIGPYLEVFKRAIPKEHWKPVFHDNAARVYHLDRQVPLKSQVSTDVQGVGMHVTIAPTGIAAVPVCLRGR